MVPEFVCWENSRVFQIKVHIHVKECDQYIRFPFEIGLGVSDMLCFKENMLARFVASVAVSVSQWEKCDALRIHKRSERDRANAK